jgi:transcriptional regulator with XRE-family HTH domain
MKPMTQVQIARKFKVARQTVSLWKREGIDLADMKALAARAATVKARVADSEDMQAAKLRKVSAEADRQQIAAKREAGELVLAANIFAEGEAAGLAFRQALEKLTHDLPPLLGGRPATEIFTILKREHRSLLEKLRDTEPHRYLENLNSSKP